MLKIWSISHPGDGGMVSVVDESSDPPEHRLLMELFALSSIAIVDVLAPSIYAHILSTFTQLAQLTYQKNEAAGMASAAQSTFDFLSDLRGTMADEDTPLMANTVRVLQVLGDAYSNQYEQHGKIEDVDMAIECYNQELLCVTAGGDDWAAVLNNIGTMHCTRFKSTGSLMNLERAVSSAAQVVTLTSDEHPHKPAYLANMGSAYSSRFLLLGELSDLDTSLECATQAVSLASERDPRKPSMLGNLGSVHHTRYKHLGHTEDLELAIRYQTEANSLLPDEDPLKLVCLVGLGLSYASRYELLEQLPDIDMAIDCATEAVSRTADGHPDKPRLLANLGGAYISRYQSMAQLSDLDMALVCHQEAVSITPDGHATKPMLLCALGVAFLVRYQHFGHLSDLDTAINFQIHAVSFIPDTHIEKPCSLTNLGSTYHVRYMRLRQLSDLQESMNCQCQAVLLVPDAHPNKPAHLNNLASSHFTLYQHLDQPAELDLAIDLISRAISLAPESHAWRSKWINNLGNCYRVRYNHTRSISDLDIGIKQLHLAVSLMHDRYYHKSGALGRLAKTYHTRYRHLGEVNDLNSAIDCKHAALAGLSGHHPDRVVVISALGEYFWDRHQLLGSEADMSRSLDYFEQSAFSLAGNPKERADAARKWAIISAAYRPQSSLKAYRYYMSLIPQVIWLGFAAKERYERVADVTDTALEAASVAIAHREYGQALEWLEQGRSIVWNQLLQLRQPLDKLNTIDAPLAEELVHVASQLKCAASSETIVVEVPESPIFPERAAQNRRRLAERWEELVKRAQTLPGIDDFLAPKKASQLVAAARSGTLVTLIALADGACNALVVPRGSTDIAHVPLRSLSYDELKRASNKLYGQHTKISRADRKFTTGRTKLDGELERTLRMLWVDIAKPILDHLGYTEILPIRKLPRITWCVTGPLSFLPLHAAGDYTKPRSSLWDYAVSSYTPTIGALLYRTSDSPSRSGVALVGQASTPGFPDLPGTAIELDTISMQGQRIPTTRLDGSNATREAVLNVLDRHSWVHLACHASQNMANPMASAFHLHDGPLDLSTITQKHVKHADLAFLSACQTATGDKELPDEAVHLAAGIIMAGYKAVIATMWPIADWDAPVVAGRFYDYMLNQGGADKNDFSRALHYAVWCLRERVGVKAYQQWVPFVHIGR
ncbi:hypothetical protein FRC12_023064 [Ceratobasidium sp. 428]|nr:hypothetical protein FRC12_023064 [Ceratobasidium sp. 428]